MEKLVLFESRFLWPWLEFCQSRSSFLASSGNFFFFFPRAGCRGAVTSALAITVQLEGVGTVSLVVLMWSFLNVEQWNV